MPKHKKEIGKHAFNVENSFKLIWCALKAEILDSSSIWWN